MKYKNKDGVELNFTGKSSTSILVKEVVSEAIEMLKYNHSELTIKFLKENFDIGVNDEK
mgnify:CR=1 FL=1|tara:strand:+ start:303 stop:479 length:177 start_codon:yes stop_codon:yes gene_type:complete